MIGTAMDAKDLARRFLREGLAGGSDEVLAEVLAPGYVDHNAPPGLPAGPAGIAQLFATYRAAFPDVDFEVEDAIAEGDRVVLRYTFRGTHSGPLFGVPATGRQVSMQGISIYRVEGGKLQEAWVTYDLLSLLQQVGAIPPSA